MCTDMYRGWSDDWRGTLETHQLISTTLLERFHTAMSMSTCASSCGEPDDPSGRRLSHRGGTGRVGVLCASGNAGSARLTWRTSSRSPASCSDRASHLGDGWMTCLLKRKRTRMRTYAYWKVCDLTVEVKGRSPVCVLMCALRWELFVYVFPQPGNSQLCVAARFLAHDLRPRFGLMLPASSCA